MQGSISLLPVSSVMDKLNLWNDDPEEVLLDLGFGHDEPDLSGRIPARFINYQSKANGINLQVFLDAQKSRLDLENPDVSNRFRQLEVFQQVTTAFTSLVGSSSSPDIASQRKDLSSEALERRRHVAMLFRRASKKFLKQIQDNKSKNITTCGIAASPSATTDSLQPWPCPEDRSLILQKEAPGLKDMVYLSPLTEEQITGPEPQSQPLMTSLQAQEGALGPQPSSEGRVGATFLHRKKMAVMAMESLEMDEAGQSASDHQTQHYYNRIYSFDVDGVTGSYSEAVHLALQGVVRTNSCQSESSSFLEQFIIPSLSRQASQGSELPKALSGQTEGNNNEPSNDKLGCSSFQSSQSLISLGDDKSCLLSTCPSSGHFSFDNLSSLDLPYFPNYDPLISDAEKPSDHNHSHPALSLLLTRQYVKTGSSALDNNAASDTDENRRIYGQVEGEEAKHCYTAHMEQVVVSNSEVSASLSQRTTLVSLEEFNQAEVDRQVLLCGLLELGPKNEVEELSCPKVSECESPRCSLVLYDKTTDAHRAKSERHDLNENDNVDLVFPTSVDGSEDESGEVDAFLQQVDTEGLVYWAEPIEVFNPTPVLEPSRSTEDSEKSSGSHLLARDPVALPSIPATLPLNDLSSQKTRDRDQPLRNVSLATSNKPSSPTLNPSSSLLEIQNLKSSGRSVSVQMSSSLSTHIVHRKDIPYETNSKYTLLPGVLPLDTSTPFRAVQSWTDLQIRRSSHTTSHGGQRNNMIVSKSASERTQRPTLTHDSLPGIVQSDGTMSASVDKGLWPNKEVERNGDGNENELWEHDQTATMTCYCITDHQCISSTQKNYDTQHSPENTPISRQELEELMLCLQKFCAVFSNMEDQLYEEQAAVYSLLSDQDRKNVLDIEELRRAVRQEAGKLERHLNELPHYNDGGLKKKMHRLLDEQSLLCCQLRFILPGEIPTSLSTTSNSH